MTRPIVTVTLNPAIDRTVWVDELVPGTTHRTADTRVAFGGKGINVARVIAGIGAPAFAIGLAGQDQAGPMEHHLESLGVRSRFVRVPGETRTNLKVIEVGSGRLTEINGSGPEVTPALIESLDDLLANIVADERAAAVVLAGSLPLGVEPSVYARWTATLHRNQPELPVLVDTSDEALELVTAAAPFFLKPNRAEAAALTGQAIESATNATAAALEIARRGPRCVLLSLGSQGAVAVWEGQAQDLPAQPIEVPPGQLHSTVGAGDAMVARIAVELARLDGAPIGPEAFFAMARLAVEEAEGQIRGMEPSHDAVAQQRGADGSPQPLTAT